MVDCKKCKNYGNRCIPAVNGECDAFVDAKVENVDHPKHYRKPGRKECIDEMLEKFGPVAVYWFSVLSAYKYRYRAGDKPDNAVEQDTAKAEWFDHEAEEMHGLGAPDGWIRCSEKLPAKHRVLLFVAYGMSVQYGMYRGDRDGHKTWEANGYTFWDDEVTHWMPLPNPPEVSKDD